MRLLNCCVLAICCASFVCAAEPTKPVDTVTHVVEKTSPVGAKSFGEYLNWPVVDIFVKPGKTVAFDGTRSWKIDRDEYKGWVLVVPQDSEQAAAALKIQHQWRGTVKGSQSRRFDVRVRGNYYEIGNGGVAGHQGGAPVASKPLIWTTLSLDLDLDVDSTFVGFVPKDNYSAEANDQDAIEETYGGTDLAAFAPIDHAVPLVLRRLMAPVSSDKDQQEKEGPQLASLIDGQVTIAKTKDSVGDVAIYYRAQNGAKVPALDSKGVLVDPLWKKIVNGDDAVMEMEGKQVGALTLVGTLTVKAKGHDDSEAVTFVDKVKVLAISIGLFTDKNCTKKMTDWPNDPKGQFIRSAQEFTDEQQSIYVKVEGLPKPYEWNVYAQTPSAGTSLEIPLHANSTVTVLPFF